MTIIYITAKSPASEMSLGSSTLLSACKICKVKDALTHSEAKLKTIASIEGALALWTLNCLESFAHSRELSIC